MSKKKFSKRKHKELLEASAELVVALRSWGFHINGPLLPRDADSGEPTGDSPFARIEKAILACRQMK